MGSSARKKKEKRKDFQKPKLRVGKTKPKADNFTDTSFKSKSIVLKQQSLTVSVQSIYEQFSHHLSLASSSKSDTQRRDALSYMANTIASGPTNLPLPLATNTILDKVLPLVLDGTASVRSQLLKLLRLLPAVDIAPRSESALLYVRAGMTHLAEGIRDDAITTLEWLLETAQEEVVGCPGGWVKTLKAFMSMMGWVVSKGPTQWTSAPKSTFGNGGKAFPRQILVLAQFLKVGLEPLVIREPYSRSKYFPLWDIGYHSVPKRSGAYAHLNLFGSPRDEESEMYPDREDRQRVFRKLFQEAVEKGIESGKKQGGEVGRAAAVLGKVVVESMSDYEHSGFDVLTE